MGGVDADLPAVEATARRGELGRLNYMSAKVRIVNPLYPNKSWEGTIVGLMDEPSIIIVDSDGRRWTLPQSFAVTELEDG